MLPDPVSPTLLPGYELRGPQGETLRVCREGLVMSLGRRSSSDLVLTDSSVSRNHAQVRLQNGTVQVRDAGSREGTSIAGKALGGGQWIALAPGGTVMIGRYPLSLREMSAPAAAPPRSSTLTLTRLGEEAVRTRLEPKESYCKALQGATEVLQPHGGLLELPIGLATLIIPDLHAQREYLLKALQRPIDGLSAFARLERGELNVLCLGDGLHGERRVRDRWLRAEKDTLAGLSSAALEEEAVEGLGLMKMIMTLKAAFPANFHYLRGNHDEVQHPTRKILKYTRLGESELFRHFLKSQFGADFIAKWAAFEKALPYLAKGRGFVASHSAPGGTLTRSEIELRTEKAFKKLAWTNNLAWEEDGPQSEILRLNLAAIGASPESFWFIGHCKVDGADYRAQLGGKLIQINPREPGQYVVALVPGDGGFGPAEGVFRL